MTRRSEPRSATVEVIGVSGAGTDGPDRPATPSNRRGRGITILILIVVALVFIQLTNTGSDTADDPSDREDDAASSRSERHSLDRLDALIAAGSLSPELLGAEVYRAEPGPDTLRFLLRSLGGIDGVTVATTEGDFDLVGFHPWNPDRLIASRRSADGPAENQDVNEIWTVTGTGAVLKSLVAPNVEHDFVQYNEFGILSFWSYAGNETGAEGDDVAPRTVTLGPIQFLNERRSDPLHPSRAVIVGDTVFALTGDPDRQSTSRVFQSLIADRGEGQVFLDDGAGWSWVDNPTSGVVVAYPVDSKGTTGVWSTESLERIEDHYLAGRTYRRLTVSDNETTLVGVTFDGTLEVVDIGTDRVTGHFGRLDPEGIVTPITLNNDGTIAITVDHDGTVTIWWVGQTEPIAVIDGDAAPPRLLSDHRAARASSAVASGGVRVAVRNRAEQEVTTTWSIIDTNPARWVELACERAGRPLTAGERVDLGLDLLPPVCD